jgi:UDP-N-acetyl-D-glucosamine dehydrogenase
LTDVTASIEVGAVPRRSSFVIDRTGAEPERTPPVIAIIGMGYVGLPTALTARANGARTIGIDTSEPRLRAIREQRVDLVIGDRRQLGARLEDDDFVLSSSFESIRDADAVLICVPTPVDERRAPDLRILRAACADVVRHAEPGQVLILTSTSYPGSTREFLAEPLRERGFEVGKDIFVASSPERIDPGNRTPHRAVARVVGGVTPACLERASAVVSLLTDEVVQVSSADAAEMTKLLENSFRAVNVAFANEIANVCDAIGVDPREIVDAAATKPYGFMPFYSGTGVGGHCIPCDPHYLLWKLRSSRLDAPLLTHAMDAIAARPFEIVDAIVNRLSSVGRGLVGSRVLVVGVAYKPGIEDIRESPGIEIVAELLRRGAEVDVHDPLVPSIPVEQQILLSVKAPDSRAYDIVLANTLHPGVDYEWLADARLLIDPSGVTRAYQLPRSPIRMVAESDGVLEMPQAAAQ